MYQDILTINSICLTVRKNSRGCPRCLIALLFECLYFEAGPLFFSRIFQAHPLDFRDGVLEYTKPASLNTYFNL